MQDGQCPRGEVGPRRDLESHTVRLEDTSEGRQGRSSPHERLTVVEPVTCSFDELADTALEAADEPDRPR